MPSARAHTPLREKPKSRRMQNSLICVAYVCCCCFADFITLAYTLPKSGNNNSNNGAIIRVERNVEKSSINFCSQRIFDFVALFLYTYIIVYIYIYFLPSFSFEHLWICMCVSICVWVSQSAILQFTCLPICFYLRPSSVFSLNEVRSSQLKEM